MSNQTPDGRVLRKLEAMRRVQNTALDLFESQGFGPVTIEQIAAASGVSAPTVYRNFGSKEGIVLWDEHEPALLATVARHLADKPVLRAVEDALTECLGPVYRLHGPRMLRRARITRSHPALVAASALDRDTLAHALAELFHAKRACADPFAAQVIAHTAVSVLGTSVHRWVQLNARVTLGKILSQAFARLSEMAAAAR